MGVVIAAVLLVLGMVATANAQDSTGIVLVDAHGVVVGPIVSLSDDDAAYVAVRINGTPFVLIVNDQGLHGSSDVYFQSPACAGPGFLESGGLALRAAVLGPRQSVYVAGSQAPRPMTVLSMVGADGTCQRVGAQGGGRFGPNPRYQTLRISAAPTVRLGDLAGRYTAPFSFK